MGKYRVGIELGGQRVKFVATRCQVCGDRVQRLLLLNASKNVNAVAIVFLRENVVATNHPSFKLS